MLTPTRAAFLRPARAAAALALAAALCAQTPPPPAKRLPPAGVAIPAAAHAELTAGAAALRKEIDELARTLAARHDNRLAALLPDVEIFHKAVDWPLRYDEFFDPKQVEIARRLLATGRERAAHLRAGRAPWTEATGLVIRGYRSALDDSVQPYALVVPADGKPGAGPPRRLDVVLAGRNEKRTELAFIAEHEKSPGEIVPAGAIVLHPYGRFCNATKFAGEADVFEALGAVQGGYAIDPDRIVVRGFSMGGASTWHLATHHAGLWCAASPGAGFAETAVYTKALAPGKEPPTWWEQKLWNWYDATTYAANLFNCPTLAYSGELDPQKQSADLMEAALAQEGLKLERFIGPQTAHKYEPATKAKLAARLDALAAQGRPRLRREIQLTTWMLRYEHVGWVRITGLRQHWERADIHARLGDDGAVTAETKNVTALRFTPGGRPPARVLLDGQALPGGDGAFWRDGDTWRSGERPAALRKQRALSGPIDDAFLDRFVFVRPTGRPFHAAVGAWAGTELAHAAKLWRDLFRGDAPVKDDTAITDADLASSNLVLWGDPSSNRVLARILAQLPLAWDARQLVFRGRHYDAAHHAPILIFPNPLNPQRYVVLNSGIDFREHAYGTNALQIAKLPDFAIVDLREPPGPRWPGRIVDAGFFDETWKPAP